MSGFIWMFLVAFDAACMAPGEQSACPFIGNGAAVVLVARSDSVRPRHPAAIVGAIDWSTVLRIDAPNTTNGGLVNFRLRAPRSRRPWRKGTNEQLTPSVRFRTQLPRRPEHGARAVTHGGKTHWRRIADRVTVPARCPSAQKAKARTPKLFLSLLLTRARRTQRRVADRGVAGHVGEAP